MTRNGMDSLRQRLIESAQMGLMVFGSLCLGSCVFAGEPTANFTDSASLNYTYPVERLKVGHSYGNKYCYVTLDGKTDVLSDRGSVRFGLRESINQKYYLLGWEVSVTTAGGKPLLPVKTIFSPAYQESRLEREGLAISKKFFLPFENNYLRSAHFLLESSVSSANEVVIRSRTFFPEGAQVEQADHTGQKYLSVRFPDRTRAVIWGSGGLQSFKVQEVEQKGVELISEFAWKPTLDEPGYALSFAYSLGGARGAPLDALFDIYAPATPLLQGHLDRVRLLLRESRSAIDRYLALSRLWTPDPLINRAVQWAKVNQLRDQQEYKLGSAFSNNPPSDTVVGRDSVWYLVGSSYYAQSWSRKLLDFWFRFGLEVNGKFTEYLTASGDPVFQDDYGLNINDNTPLFLIAAHQYYSLTGDQGFLHSAYPSLINSANYILEQRKVGENNRHGLVWCTSTETFVRGLCGWRNVIRGYNLSGAVTEINAECYRALVLTAELAKAVGDQLNRERLEMAAQDLHQAIEKHLRAATASNRFYYLMINPAGRPVGDMTGDLLFPVLFGVSDPPTARGILSELFSDRFWVSRDDGAGGIRTVSSAERGYQAKADPANYGLLGGVWPNLALWVARAAADQGLPNLTLKALRGTVLLSENENPARYNVVPGELPEYFNGDDLVQRGQPRSTFLFGIFIWSALEGFLGLSPHPAGLQVNPALPDGWDWAAVSNMPYRGCPLSMIAVRQGRVLYTTVPVDTKWKQVVVPAVLQQKFSFRPDGQAFWLVIPNREGREILATSAQATTGKLVEQDTGRVLVELSIPAGAVVRKKIPQ